jgi:hypothetical protein
MVRGIAFQHNVSVSPFGIIVLRARSNRMRDLRPLVPSILAAVDTVEPRLVRRVGA